MKNAHHPSSSIASSENEEVQPDRPEQEKGRKSGIGFIVLFLLATGFLAANTAIVGATRSTIVQEQKEAEESARPADITLQNVFDPSCTTCFSFDTLATSMKNNAKMNVTASNAVDSRTEEGQALVKEFGLTRIPSLLIRGETAKMLKALPGLSSLGALQGDVFVGNITPAPYRDLASNTVRGEFSATFITDNSCAECYKTTSHLNALSQLGMKPTTQATVDRQDAEGKKLIKEYAVTSVPTVLLKGDFEAYNGFENVWKNVGTVEADGMHIFRSGQAQMGTYFDLASNKVIVPKSSSTNTNANINTSQP